MLALVLSCVGGGALAAPGDLSAYLRARAAEADGQVDRAVVDYAAALAGAPDDPVVALRAYREALAAGDTALVDRAATVLRAAGVAPPDATLQSLAQAAHDGDATAAEQALALLKGTPLAPLAPGMRAWVDLARGVDPAATLAQAGRDPVARRFAEEARALTLIASGRTEAGLTALHVLLGPAEAHLDLRVAAARLLAGQGRGADAQKLLPGDDSLVAAIRAQLGVGARPSPAFGVAWLLTEVAGDLASGDPSPLSIAMTRAALRADPTDDRARLLLADALAHAGATERALRSLAEVDAHGPFAGVARSERVSVLAGARDPAATLAAARATAGAPTATPFDLQRLGNDLVDAHRYDEAAEAFTRLTRATPDEWTAWLQLGGALDQGGRWPEARAALAHAVALAPDEPLALNYLGYAQIDHGQDVAASERMLERASALKPDDASITDSLAWAYYRRGDLARATPMLERAAQGEPTNATIAEHLGDAYWAAGRRYEARYAWRAAAVLADGNDVARLRAKAADGPAPERRR